MGLMHFYNKLRATFARQWRLLLHRVDHLNINALWHAAYYIIHNPWKLHSQNEKFRFEESNRIIQEYFGKLDYIIELGSGEGHQSSYLENICDSLIGIEASTAAIKRAQKRCPKATFIKHDLNSGLPEIVPSTGKGLIVICEMIYYMQDPSSLLKDVLKTNAHVFISIYKTKMEYVMERVRKVLNEIEFSDYCIIQPPDSTSTWYGFLIDRTTKNAQTLSCETSAANRHWSANKVYSQQPEAVD